MMKVEVERDCDFKRIFTNEYFDIVSNYVKLIQSVINQYDTVIFMARKAYCFYNSVKEANFIEEKDDSNIFSSRALTYSKLDLSNQKVAIIEDVVVKGISLDEVISSELFDNVNLDVYIAACSSEFLYNFNYKENINLCDPYIIMDEKQLLEFATLITNFIISKNIPYNIDNPIYEITCSQFNIFKNFFSNNNFCQISELLNDNKDNICKGSIHINSSILSNILPENICKETVVKFRVYMNLSEDKCLLVPIILFPKMSFDVLENAFRKIYKSEILNNLKNCKNYNENIFKIFQYGISNLSVIEYLKQTNLFNSSKNLLNEIQIFSTNISNYLIDNVIKINNNFDDYSINQFELYNYLAFAYDVLFINKKNISDNYIDYKDISNLIMSSTDKHIDNLFVYVSLILDVFIDNGIVVPRFLINKNNVLRIYKFGEVAQLTINDFILFANVLSEYSNMLNKDLEGIEIEKISVLFFKKFHKAFDNNSNKSETFRVCYSKFGPRIASSRKAYKAYQSETLMHYLSENNLLKKISKNGKNVYDVPTKTTDKNFVVSDVQCSMFVYGLNILYKQYKNVKSIEDSNEIFKLINSYNRLLTLLAIGNEEKSKILSLIAEVHLIRGEKFDDLYYNAKQSLYKLGRIIDGILSGVWKYACYSEEELINKIFILMSKYSKSKSDIYLILSSLGIQFDNNIKLNFNFIEEIGLYLLDVVLFYYYACNYLKLKFHSDFKSQLYSDLLFKNKKVDSLHNYYNTVFQDSKLDVNVYIKSKFEKIAIKACDLMDKFSLYNLTLSFNFSNLNSCYILYDYSSDEKQRIDKSRIIYVKYKNILLFPIFSTSIENTERKILLSLYDIIKDSKRRIILYESPNKDISLKCMNTKVIGEKFFKYAYNAFRSYTKLNYLDRNEFTKISSIDNGGNFDIYNYSFNFINSKSIICENTDMICERYSVRSKQNFNVQIREINNSGNLSITEICNCQPKETEKEVKNVKIDNITVENGNTYIAETITWIETCDQTVIDDLNIMKNKSENEEIKKYIKDAIDAKKEKNESKLKEALKWIGENAMELVKTVASSTTVAFIQSCLK